MGTFLLDCPYEGCRAHRAAFVSVASSPIGKGQWNLFATCPICRGGVALIVQELNFLSNSDDPHMFSGTSFREWYRIYRVSPEPPKMALVENLPEPVERALIEAENLYTMGKKFTGSAAAAYRKAVERSLKILDQEGRGSLFARIEAMGGKLSPDLIKLMHEVRFLGNDGAHELEDPSMADIAFGRDLVRLFLIYAFDLPEKLRGAEAKRQPTAPKALAKG